LKIKVSSLITAVSSEILLLPSIKLFAITSITSNDNTKHWYKIFDGKKKSNVFVIIMRHFISSFTRRKFLNLIIFLDGKEINTI